MDELEVAVTAGWVCMPRAAGGARLVGDRMAGICVRSIQGLLGRRWDLAVGDICRCCLPTGPRWLFPASSRMITRYAAEGGVQHSLRAPVSPLVVRHGSGARGDCCQVSSPGVC